jgi:antitoxin component YwqK of YwqJK toxin-antitoxin module
MGRKNGDWKKFDESGFLLITISYTNGREVKYDGISVENTD